jgi:hypothetical protein
MIDGLNGISAYIVNLIWLQKAQSIVPVVDIK